MFPFSFPFFLLSFFCLLFEIFITFDLFKLLILYSFRFKIIT
jgi:hypothetical protein